LQPVHKGEAMRIIHANAKTCPHCRALIVSQVLDDGQSPPCVAELFRITPSTVRKWLRRFRDGGALALEDKSSAPASIPRRKLQPGPELNSAVMRLLHAPPADYGFNRTSWRMRDLKSVLDQQGMLATLNSISASIRTAGFRWKQARIALTSNDPEYRTKLEVIKKTLANLSANEAFFSIDEMGPIAVKMRAGRSLQAPNQTRTVPQWQRSKGTFILSAALDLSRNQVTYFFSERKNTNETIRLLDLLRQIYPSHLTLFLSWDAAPWHDSAHLHEHLTLVNANAKRGRGPRVEVLPLPRSSQFLNVIESVFSGLARAVLHNSDYTSLEQAKAAVARYLDDRNAAFRINPRPAGKSIWGKERTPVMFSDENNCKDPRWIGQLAKRRLHDTPD
jgi:transposase